MPFQFFKVSQTAFISFFLIILSKNDLISSVNVQLFSPLQKIVPTPLALYPKPQHHGHHHSAVIILLQIRLYIKTYRNFPTTSDLGSLPPAYCICSQHNFTVTIVGDRIEALAEVLYGDSSYYS